MSALHAIVLGIVQGLTEFLPISSSGHLVFIPEFLGWPDQGLAFDVMVHLGTLVAVVAYFRQKIWQLLRSFFSAQTTATKERLLAWFVLLSIIPAGAVGYFLGQGGRSPAIVATSLIFWGVVLGAADWYAKKRIKDKKPLTDLNHMKAWQVAAVACAQAIALIPGTSRSGITMTAGLFSGFTKKAAAEFSFLISIPIIALAGALKVFELTQEGLGGMQLSVLILGAASAAVSGFLAIWGLLKIIERWSFLPFALYRVVVGILILVFLV